MKRRNKQRMGLLARFWKLTGGGFITGFLLVLALTCILLLIAIGSWTNANSSNESSSTTTQTQSEDQNSGEAKSDEWIDGLDEGDTTNIGNRINTSQLPDSSFIYEVSIEELANADSYLDEQTVQVIGEVVGDRITSETNPKYCWITLQSKDEDDSEISVYMSKSASKAIDVYGAYDKDGTTLQVRGTFYLASEDHQGASEIRAESVSVVSPGQIVEDSGNPKSMQSGLALILVGSLLMLLFNILRERQR